MPDREKVITAMDCCMAGGECDHCPYARDNKQGYEGCYQMHADALALLKEREPRVMTLAEALAEDYVYLEIKLHASLPCDCCILAIDPDGGILPLKKGFAGYLDGEEYGETWRCWTSRPTEAQRRETAWPNS